MFSVFISRNLNNIFCAIGQKEVQLEKELEDLNRNRSYIETSKIVTLFKITVFQ